MVEDDTILDPTECEPCSSDGVGAASVPAYLCAVEEAARIVGQKWTLQIVNVLMDFHARRFCELQEGLGGVNPSTLSARLKMLEEQGLVEREQISGAPPHVVYRLTPMGEELSGAIRELTRWSRVWLCDARPNATVPRDLEAIHQTVGSYER